MIDSAAADLQGTSGNMNAHRCSYVTMSSHQETSWTYVPCVGLKEYESFFKVSAFLYVHQVFRSFRKNMQTYWVTTKSPALTIKKSNESHQ